MFFVFYLTFLFYHEMYNQIMNNTDSIKTIDQYIVNYPEDVQLILKKVRQTIQDAAPEAKEKMSYGIPTFYLNGNLVHFGAYPKHIGFYPGAQALVDFAPKLKDYNTSKGTVQFQLNQPIPYDLIRDITLARVSMVKENTK